MVGAREAGREPDDSREVVLRKVRYARREFIRTMTVAAGGATLIPGCGKAPRPWRFFTEQEAAAVAAIAEQIIPADEDPGAIDAGVPNFIDKQLVGPYKRFQERYRSGIAGVDAASREMRGKAFVEMGWDDQTALLKAMESGKVKGPAWQEQTAAAFFDLIRDHTMQGFYGSPRHGGNRDYVSYRMLKLDYPQVIGQNRYKVSAG